MSLSPFTQKRTKLSRMRVVNTLSISPMCIFPLPSHLPLSLVKGEKVTSALRVARAMFIIYTRAVRYRDQIITAKIPAANVCQTSPYLESIRSLLKHIFIYSSSNSIYPCLITIKFITICFFVHQQMNRKLPCEECLYNTEIKARSFTPPNLVSLLGPDNIQYTEIID
jgi:hypothetical protein